MVTQEALIDPNLNALLIGGGVLNQGSTLLDRMVELSGVEGKPRVLMIPSAKGTSEQHDDYVKRIGGYFTAKGVDFENLHPFLLDEASPTPNHPAILERLPSHEQLADSIGRADVVFTAGGNTRKMIHDIWKPAGIDKLLEKAVKEGKVMAGTSAGAIAWFKGGHSDWQQYETDKPYGADGWQYDYVEGLGHIDGLFIPHFDDRTKDGAMREDVADELLIERANQGIKEFALGIDNYTALEVVQGGLVKITHATNPELSNQRFGAFMLRRQPDGSFSKTRLSQQPDHVPYATFVAE